MSIHDEVVANPKSTSRCPGCRTLFKPYELFYEANSNGVINVARGWLIVHDENAPPQTFDLLEGVNSCGRNPGDNETNHVKSGNIIRIITKDTKMSRVIVHDLELERCHFSIEVIKQGFNWSFVIKDNKSLNHTYIDTKRIDDFTREMRVLRPPEEIYLDDGAIILAGETKIHFKVADNINSRDAVSKVIHGQEFTKTVIL